MSWLVIGIAYGSELHTILMRPTVQLESMTRLLKALYPPRSFTKILNEYKVMHTHMHGTGEDPPIPDHVLFYVTAFLCPAAIGGMVVVGMMIRDYGVCTLIG